MRFIRFLCAGALALPGIAGANELLNVYDLAQKNDATLQAAEAFHDASIEARPQARAALLPNVVGTYGYNKQDVTGTTTQAGFDQTTGQVVVASVPADQSFTDKPLTVSLRQTLFDWGAFQRYFSSGDQVSLAETNFRSAKQNLVLRVAAAYFNVLASVDALRSSNAENKAVGRQLEQAKKRFEVGLSAITDVQEAQARYDLTVSQQITAQQLLDSSKEALAVITGQPMLAFAPLQEDIPLPAPDPTDVNVWVKAAADGNFDLLASRYIASIAKRDVDIAWARHYPTIGGSYTWRKDSTSGTQFGDSIEQDTKTRTLAITLTVPIFEGLGTQSLVRQAKATREQRNAEYELNRRNLERQTRDAYQGVIAGAARVKALKQAVVSNTTALDASETGLQVGARTEVDVLTASQLLYAAERDYLRSRYDYLISVLNLKAAAGRLGAKDLAEIDRLLVTTPTVPPAGPIPPASPG
jgi:outer membrane protein